MIKTGAIYNRRGNQRRHTCADIPIGKETFLLKSTSDEVDTKRESIYCDPSAPAHKENQMETLNLHHRPHPQKSTDHDSFFDSLTQYERKPAADPNVKAILSLQQIFREMKTLQALEKERNNRRLLSDIENKLLSFERAVLNH